MSASYQQIKDTIPLKGNGPDVLLFLWQLTQSTIIPTDGLICEVKEKAGVETVLKCPFSQESSDWCVYISHLYSEAICNLVNPEYECVFTHHLSNGDPYCRVIFKKKSSPSSVLDDPGVTLATLPQIVLPRRTEVWVAFGWRIKRHRYYYISIHRSPWTTRKQEKY